MTLDTHQVLTRAGYHNREDYPQIAKRAAEIIKEEWLTKKTFLARIREEFGDPPGWLLPEKSPRKYAMFGTPGVDFDYGAVQQMNQVMQLPVSVAGAMMPDAHPGYAMPIGGVAALKHAVSPSFVGYDIACRVSMSILDIAVEEFREQRENIARDMRAVSSFGMGAGFKGPERRDHPVMSDPLWKELRHVKNLKDKAWLQLGSSGGGNHFFDAMIGEVLQDVPWLPLKKGQSFVAIVTHSGSRGTGHNLATFYVKLARKETAAIARKIPKGYEWLNTEKDSGREYLAVMELMGRYAQANHQLIHQHFLKQSGLQRLAWYENHHNYAWEETDGLIVHRKGATPAEKGVPGIIPGTSGTASYLVEGLGNGESLQSSSHGAGRPFSRTEAKRRHDEAYVRTWMREKDILTFGLAADETLMAYKDIEHVMSLQTELVKPVARMLPKVVIMGGKSDDGD